MITKLQKGSGDVIVSLCMQMVSVKSVTLKICCAVRCCDLTENTFASGEFQCSIYFTTNGEKVYACFSGRGKYYSEVYIYFSGTSALIETNGSFY